MKLCIECKWSRLPLSGEPEDSKCAHPELSSRVTGKPSLNCSIERSGSYVAGVYPCGKEGNLFEPKEQTTVATGPETTASVLALHVVSDNAN